MVDFTKITDSVFYTNRNKITPRRRIIPIWQTGGFVPVFPPEIRCHVHPPCPASMIVKMTRKNIGKIVVIKKKMLDKANLVILIIISNI